MYFSKRQRFTHRFKEDEKEIQSYNINFARENNHQESVYMLSKS
jgi:hypothetical protein